MQEAAVMPLEYLGMKLEKLYESVMSTYPGEENWKAEKNHAL